MIDRDGRCRSRGIRPVPSYGRVASAGESDAVAFARTAHSEAARFAEFPATTSVVPMCSAEADQLPGDVSSISTITCLPLTETRRCIVLHPVITLT